MTVWKVTTQVQSAWPRLHVHVHVLYFDAVLMLKGSGHLAYLAPFAHDLQI